MNFLFSDGRLRIGDEIVYVNGHHLRGIQSPGYVQNILTFIDDAVDLVISHDEFTTFSSDYGPKLKLDYRQNGCSLLANDANDLTAVRKRLSFTNCADSSDTQLYVTNVESNSVRQNLRTSNNSPGHTERNSNFSEQRKTIYDHDQSRRLSLNRSLALTPLFDSTEYIPVYANRVTITNTISDDEKWQILSKKRSEMLSKSGYNNQSTACNDHTKSIPSSNENKEELNSKNAVYSLCRQTSPYNGSSIRNESSVTIGAKSTPFVTRKLNECRTASDTRCVLNPQYRSIKINKELYAFDQLAKQHQRHINDEGRDNNNKMYAPTSTSSFGIQKSPTDSCITAINVYTKNQADLSNNRMVDVTDSETKCDTTISIHVNDEGGSYVEGMRILFFLHAEKKNHNKLLRSRNCFLYLKTFTLHTRCALNM